MYHTGKIIHKYVMSYNAQVTKFFAPKGFKDRKMTGLLLSEININIETSFQLKIEKTFLRLRLVMSQLIRKEILSENSNILPRRMLTN